MAGQTKVGEERIRAALDCWRGNLAATAESLGIAENSLRKRLKKMGIGQKALALLRAVRTSPSHTHPHPSAMPTPPTVASAVPHRPQENDGPTFSSVLDFPKFGSMQEGAVAVARLPRARLRPDQLDQIRDAKYDMQAKHRIDLREEDLLQRFFDKKWTDFIREELAEQPAHRGKEKA